MRKNLIFTLALLAVLLSGAKNATAQFQIKIPKINKPKVEQPKQEQPNPADNNSAPVNQPARNQPAKSQPSAVQPPRVSNKALFLKDTLEIKIKSDNKYWKTPKEDYHTSWVPQVSFRVLYDESTKPRYTAEWFKADGSLWFSESLRIFSRDSDFNFTTTGAASEYNGSLFDNASTDQIGTYGLKLTDNQTGETLFQGKFKVGKSLVFPGDARRKNFFQFYVENDWMMPIGFAGFDSDSWRTSEPLPTVLFWFKGEVERSDLEAKLFHNNQEIASTKGGGLVNDRQRRSDECVLGQEVCKYVLYAFSWNRFMLDSQSYLREKYPDAVFTRDKPGEYTVKVFHKGVQVREARFTVEPSGAIAKTAFSNQIYPTLVLIPVKVMGTAEKWNPNSWKTDAFYGNPLTGFNVP